ncbi:type II toxin-antitoxin system VapC family toxin [Rhodoferax sp.]|uniref:type II toxin-antitoxin system VapC family toxin n=1 Tax=Rhodoferax sp. TaxID=50421 RepID=UPI00261DDABC|nr:type II toxin-antitoxin system VapC family toxin [Rhodoferax sp.]MDD2809696.1 type II toxin-antitoxin system VapC family toxin [Rhodoferax sp.]MDD4944876.1 type II toxin-antitoxin system VapC family toxin [Rhodoferax sp.]
MLYLLDTNIISYFVKGISASLVQRMRAEVDAQNIAISAVTRAELRYGVELMDKFDKRRRRIELVLKEFPTLPWRSDAADEFGRIRAYLKRNGTPVGEFDTQIAAHALAEKLILVTHNTRHFENVPHLKLEDWMV